MAKLKNKRAVILGGSRGIGKAIAEAYLKEGAEVFLAARNAEELAATQNQLSRLGVVSTAAMDVSKEGDMKHLAEHIGKLWGSIDVLVNAAGIYGPIGPLTDVDPAEWKKTIDINLFGTFLATRAFAPLMKMKGGVIINFVGGGEGAYPSFSAYASSKGGVARFTETAATELKADNIRMNAIAPGAVNTKFLDELLAAGPEKAGKETYEKSIKQKESGGVSPEKAAALCVFLASDASIGLSGKILSAVWDTYETFPDHMGDIMSSDMYTMRRKLPPEQPQK
jgi:3-oxoacyl-[acyl-carrier protein] reductase